jgi:NAD(P)-dependent dehydrogenase (short-subunit alcohol dehydrogenase family)
MDLQSKTVVITGASAGIGAAAARELHALGARVIPVGRDAARTAEIATAVGSEGLVCDYEKLDDVRRLAADLAALGPIDVLVNNAGGVWPDRMMTVDGFERTFQVNHLAPYLLTRLLHDQLAAASGRVVTTSSAAHSAGRLVLDDLDGANDWKSWTAYGTSKLANILFTDQVAVRWKPDGVTATSLHPGVVATKFGRDSGLLGVVYRSPLKVFLRDADKGADTLVWLASADAGQWLDGAYYSDRRLGKRSPQALDSDLAVALWDRSATMVGLPA